MRLKHTTQSKRREPDLTSLINVVFLILIFFIVAGTLRPFSAKDIQLAKSPEGSGVTEPVSLIMDADGAISWRGQSVSLPEFERQLSEDKGLTKTIPVTIVADARMDAKKLLELTRLLRGAGFGETRLLTEKPRAK